jgi:hypothetical protein
MHRSKIILAEFNAVAATSSLPDAKDWGFCSISRESAQSSGKISRVSCSMIRPNFAGEPVQECPVKLYCQFRLANSIPEVFQTLLSILKGGALPNKYHVNFSWPQSDSTDISEFCPMLLIKSSALYVGNISCTIFFLGSMAYTINQIGPEITVASRSPDFNHMRLRLITGSESRILLPIPFEDMDSAIELESHLCLVEPVPDHWQAPMDQHPISQTWVMPITPSAFHAKPPSRFSIPSLACPICFLSSSH